MSKTRAREHFECAFEQILLGDRAKALHQLQAGLLIDQDDADSWANRGKLLIDMGHPFEGMASLQRALSLKENAGFHNDLGTAFVSMQRPYDAMKCYDRALEIQPGSPIVVANKAALAAMIGRVDESIALYEQVLALYPDQHEFHFSYGMALLRAGRFGDGFRHYEWRTADGLTWARRGRRHPEWKGGSLEGKTLVVFNDQGHGDFIQFMRYAPIVKRKFGGAVLLEAREPLVRLAKTLKGIDGVATFGDDPEGVDCCASIMSLPLLCGTETEADVPADVPYVSAQDDGRWERRLAALPKGTLKVGICWAGQNREAHRQAAEIDERRSMRLAQFAGVAQIPGVAWVSLQKGEQAPQVHRPPPGMTIGAWPDDMTDFHATAALISKLDLVISVDTSVAHLAGALGKPVWMLSRFDACWRWLDDRPGSPWYPTMRQFRQKAWGDWGSVLREVEAALAEFVKRRRSDAVINERWNEEAA